MSRRHVSADEPGCTWEYGWDPQRQTFHARLLAGEGPARSQLVRFGTRLHEIGSTDALMYLMGVRLSGERVAVLERDRLTNSEDVEASDEPRTGVRRGRLPDRRPAPGVRVRAIRLGMVTDQVR